MTGSNRLSDDALRRACYTVRFLFADRADVRQSYYKAFGRFALMATTEVHILIKRKNTFGLYYLDLTVKIMFEIIIKKYFQ